MVKVKEQIANLILSGRKGYEEENSYEKVLENTNHKESEGNKGRIYKDADIVNSLTVQTTHGGVSIKLTPKRVFGSLGVTANAYLTYSEVINEKGTAALKNGDTVLQFWVTPDSVFVTGTASRQYKGLASKNDVGLQAESTVVSTYSEYSGS